MNIDHLQREDEMLQLATLSRPELSKHPFPLNELVGQCGKAAGQEITGVLIFMMLE